MTKTLAHTLCSNRIGYKMANYIKNSKTMKLVNY